MFVIILAASHLILAVTGAYIIYAGSRSSDFFVPLPLEYMVVSMSTIFGLLGFANTVHLYILDRYTTLILLETVLSVWLLLGFHAIMYRNIKKEPNKSSGNFDKKEH